MSNEYAIQRAGWLRASRTSVLFRLNTGKAWAASGKAIRLTDGSVKLPGGRPIALGFSLPNGDPVVGAGDLIGRTSIVITQAMVGKTVAVFTSLEAKNSKGGRHGPEQKNWDEQTRAAGGISGFFSSPEEAADIVASYIQNLEKT